MVPVIAAIAVLACAAALPLPPRRAYLNLVRLPILFYGVLAILVISYLLLAQVVKVFFYKMANRKIIAR